MVECTPRYEPRRPEATILYRIFQEHLETFLRVAQDEDGASLPGFVVRELRRYLQCGVLAYGFARVRCKDCGDDMLLPYSCKGRGFCPGCCSRRMCSSAAHLVDHVLPPVPIRHLVLTLPAPVRFLIVYRPELIDLCLARYARTVFEWIVERTGAKVDPSSGCGAVTFIQRFSSSLALFVHFHSLILSGVYEPDPSGHTLRFRPLPEPSADELRSLENRVAGAIVSLLEERGLLEEGEIVVPPEDLQPTNTLEACQSASLQNRIAFGPRSGRTLARLGADPLARYFDDSHLARRSGFSLFVGRALGPDQKEAIERLARYISRPPLSDDRLALTPEGRVRLQFHHPHADGATGIEFEPMEFLARIAALIPPPHKNQLRYHGILAPNATWRPDVVPSPALPIPPTPAPDPHLLDPGIRPFPPRPHRSRRSKRCPATPRWLSWASLIQRAFHVDPLICDRCGGRREIIAQILDPAVVVAILDCLGLPSTPPPIHPARRTRQESLEFEP